MSDLDYQQQQQQQIIGQEEQVDLERNRLEEELFGGTDTDSDLSELDEDLGSFEMEEPVEEEKNVTDGQYQNELEQKQDDDFQDQAEEDEDEEYQVRQSASSLAKVRKKIVQDGPLLDAKRKKARRGSSTQGQQQSSQKAAKSRGRIEGGDGDDDEDVNGSVSRQINNEYIEEFDQVVNSFKSTNRRRFAQDDIGEDTDADELISQVCQAMRDAAEQDIESNQNKQPAVEKLKLLPIVQDLLSKTFLYEQILDHEMLECLRIWLEPLPDGSLPNYKIKKSIFDILVKLPVSTDQVRDSKIGRIVAFYAKNDKELVDIKKCAMDLIFTWSRPLVMKNGNHGGAGSQSQQSLLQRRSSGGGGGANGQDGRLMADDLVTRRVFAQIPVANRSAYTVVPRSAVNDGMVITGPGSRQGDGANGGKVGTSTLAKRLLKQSGGGSRR
ncbi:hypothetical protein MIR68_006682 [Amoeboaphelidium protococcarum]|nr:hypothetical protein MIR68_006682 [Amoeboaphelidium protococcarum]